MREIGADWSGEGEGRTLGFLSHHPTCAFKPALDRIQISLRKHHFDKKAQKSCVGKIKCGQTITITMGRAADITIEIQAFPEFFLLFWSLQLKYSIDS